MLTPFGICTLYNQIFISTTATAILFLVPVLELALVSFPIVKAVRVAGSTKKR